MKITTDEDVAKAREEARVANEEYEAYMAKRWAQYDAAKRRQDNPLMPDELEAACGPGHTVQLNTASWRGTSIECSGCHNLIAVWHDEFRGKEYKDGPFIDRAKGWRVTAAGELPCEAANGS